MSLQYLLHHRCTARSKIPSFQEPGQSGRVGHGSGFYHLSACCSSFIPSCPRNQFCCGVPRKDMYEPVQTSLSPPMMVSAGMGQICRASRNHQRETPAGVLAQVPCGFDAGRVLFSYQSRCDDSGLSTAADPKSLAGSRR